MPQPRTACINVRLGSVADKAPTSSDVRYVPEADMRFLAFKLSQSNPIRSEVMRPLGVLIEIN
jgi:hypothetical protein